MLQQTSKLKKSKRERCEQSWSKYLAAAQWGLCSKGSCLLSGQKSLVLQVLRWDYSWWSEGACVWSIWSSTVLEAQVSSNNCGEHFWPRLQILQPLPSFRSCPPFLLAETQNYFNLRLFTKGRDWKKLKGLRRFPLGVTRMIKYRVLALEFFWYLLLWASLTVLVKQTLMNQILVHLPIRSLCFQRKQVNFSTRYSQNVRDSNCSNYHQAI